MSKRNKLNISNYLDWLSTTEESLLYCSNNNLIASYAITPYSGSYDVISKNSTIIPSGGAVYDYIQNQVGSEIPSIWSTLNSKANDSNVVHRTGAETISGIKSFYDVIKFGLDATHTTNSTGIGDSETAGRASLYCRRAFKNGDASTYYDYFIDPNKSKSSKMTEVSFGTGGYTHKRGGTISIYTWEDDNNPTDYPEEADTRFCFAGLQGPRGGADWCIWLTKDSLSSSVISSGSTKLVTGGAVYDYMNSSDLVHKTGNESISGFKMFYSAILTSSTGITIGPTSTTSYEGNVRMHNVDDVTSGSSASEFQINKKGYNNRLPLTLKISSSKDGDDTSDRYEFWGDKGNQNWLKEIISADSSKYSSINSSSNILVDGKAVYDYIESVIEDKVTAILKEKGLIE